MNIKSEVYTCDAANRVMYSKLPINGFGYGDILGPCINGRDVPNVPLALDITSTLEERGKRYGKFVSQAVIAQGLKDVMQAAPNWSTLPPDMKESLDMFANKIGRILNGDPGYADSWHDISGYAKLIEDRLNGTER